MKIDKSTLDTLWYEDEEGNKIKHTEEYRPNGAVYQVSQFPLEVNERHFKLIYQEDVNKCRHRRAWIKRTYGWVKGIKGRECQCCHGTQVRKWWQPWGRRWEGYGSRQAFSSSAQMGGGTDALLMAMANSGDYTLSEAILIYARACERCSNVLWNKYIGGGEGYEEYSEEWKKVNTVCDFCNGE